MKLTKEKLYQIIEESFVASLQQLDIPLEDIKQIIRSMSSSDNPEDVIELIKGYGLEDDPEIEEYLMKAEIYKLREAGHMEQAADLADTLGLRIKLWRIMDPVTKTTINWVYSEEEAMDSKNWGIFYKGSHPSNGRLFKDRKTVIPHGIDGIHGRGYTEEYFFGKGS